MGGEEHPVVTKYKSDPPPQPEPDLEPVDDHRRGPLDNWEDAKFLDPTDPRRVSVEVKRGERFRGD